MLWGLGVPPTDLYQDRSSVCNVAVRTALKLVFLLVFHSVLLMYFPPDRAASDRKLV